MKGYLVAIALGAAMATGVAAPATAMQWTLDKSHASVKFEVDHLGFSETIGVFREFDMDLTLDPENPDTASVSAVIFTGSIDSFWEARDEHLRNEDFFDVENHPEMSFASTGIEMTGEDTAVLSGDLTMLGVTKPVELDVTFNKRGTNPFSKKDTIGFEAETTISRSDWGMNYALPAVGDEVEIEIEAEFFAE